eukprot:gene1777-16263_t
MPGFRPSRRLTSRTLCNALRAFVVSVVTKLLSVISLRALPKKEKSKREIDETEEEISQDEEAGGVEEDLMRQLEAGSSNKSPDRSKTHEAPKVRPGISFWLVIDVPESSIPTVRSRIMQLILASGLEIDQCKPIMSRKKPMLTMFMPPPSVRP